MQRSYHCRMLILGVTAALASCLLALALAAPSAQAATQRGDLSISLTDGPDPLESGYLTYGLSVKHEAVDSCDIYSCWYDSGRISVTDTLPSGVTLVDVNYPATTSNGSSVSCSGTSTVTCTIGNLNDGKPSVDIDIVVKPTTAGAQTLTNTATVSSADSYYSGTYPDPDTTNNSSTSNTQVSESYTPPSGSYTRPPNTTLSNAPDVLSNNASPSLSFTSNTANATFECRMDAGAYQSCTSPKQYFLISEGQHTFQVRATDASGNVDPTPAKHTWTVDSFDPKVTFTQMPGNATRPDKWQQFERVTNDRTPSWAWTVEDTNPVPSSDYCRLYEQTNYRTIYSTYGCSSPLNFEGELPDGPYGFWIEARDKAGNYGYSETVDFEVDTVAPTVVSATPTGRRVSPYADVVVTFDDNVYGSAKFVKIYQKGSRTPLAVYPEYSYEDGDKKIELDPKSYLKRDTTYTVKVTTGVTDGANNLEAAKTWSFKTK